MSAGPDQELTNAANGILELANQIHALADHLALPNDLAHAIHKVARSVAPLIAMTGGGNSRPFDLVNPKIRAVVERMDPVLGHITGRAQLPLDAFANAKDALDKAAKELAAAIKAVN